MKERDGPNKVSYWVVDSHKHLTGESKRVTTTKQQKGEASMNRGRRNLKEIKTAASDNYKELKPIILEVHQMTQAEVERKTRMILEWEAWHSGAVSGSSKERPSKEVEDFVNKVFHRGMLTGKFHALNWVLGDCWPEDFYHFARHSEARGKKRRALQEIVEAVQTLTDRVWYNRHQLLAKAVETGEEKVAPDIWKGARRNAKKLEKKYGMENLNHDNILAWGVINGRLSALRWVLGDEWDMLDT